MTITLPDLSKFTVVEVAIVAAVAWYSGAVAWLRLSGIGARVAHNASAGHGSIEILWRVLYSPLLAVAYLLRLLAAGKSQPAERPVERPHGDSLETRVNVLENWRQFVGDWPIQGEVKNQVERFAKVELVAITQRLETEVDRQKGVIDVLLRRMKCSGGYVTIGTGPGAKTIPIVDWNPITDPARPRLPDGWNYASEVQPPDGTEVELWWLDNGSKGVKGKWNNAKYHGCNWGTSHSDLTRLEGTAWRLVKKGDV